MNRTPTIAPKGIAAPLLRWLLWSPRRVVTIAAVVLCLGAALTHLDDLAHLVHQPAPAPVAAPPVSVAPKPTVIPVPVPPSPEAVPSTPVAVATRFSTDWVRHDVDPAVWLARLQPLCSDEYGKVVLPTVDPTTVPASKVSGPAKLLRSANRTATVRVPLDQLAIEVSLVDTTGRGHWLVTEVAPTGGR
ncbi:hypothetical protein [Pseudonocardia spinosispora]|uniref:hypothetical protein n=1 Tax=Pseudonocardia spinosispora TaxID=103441 RepID=UPI0003F52DE1|nr:hypothetical protein [Pseudonocardia spinosispora]